MFVKPGPHPDDKSRLMIIRKPDGRLLRAEGEDVPETQFWHRRVTHGDVVLADPPTPAAEHKAAADPPVAAADHQGDKA